MERVPLRPLVRPLGILLTGLSALLLFELLLIWWNEKAAGITILTTHNFYLYTAICLGIAVIGIALAYSFEAEYMTILQGMTFAALVWLIAGFVAAMPYYLASGPSHLPFKYALFESFSGLTATGLTAYSNVQVLPKAILFWRSFTEWIGGLGVITFALSLLIRGLPVASALYRGEGREEAEARLGIFDVARRLWVIYIALTFIVFAMFRPYMSAFDAINHAMTAIATGGFSTKNNSLAAFALPVQIAAIVAMFMGAISFQSYHNLFRRKKIAERLRAFFNKETILLLIIPSVLALTYFIIIRYLPQIFGLCMKPSMNSFQYYFTAVSAITGTGFAVHPLQGISDLLKMTLIILMVIGGCYGSTSSALKILRLIIIFDFLAWLLRKTYTPKGEVTPLKVLGRTYKLEEVAYPLIYVWLYIALLLIAAMVISLARILSGMHPFPFINVLFEVASAQGNVGLSVGVSGPHMGIVTDAVLIFTMWAGRLEIIPVLAFFYVLWMNIRGAIKEKSIRGGIKKA